MSDLDKRRDEILVKVQREARAAAGRRRAVRRGGGVVCSVLVVAVFVRFAPTGGVSVVSGPAVAERDVRIVDTRADVAAYAISDDELVAALEATGEAFTLIWVDGEARLVEAVEEGDGGAV